MLHQAPTTFSIDFKNKRCLSLIILDIPKGKHKGFVYETEVVIKSDIWKDCQRENMDKEEFVKVFCAWVVAAKEKA